MNSVEGRIIKAISGFYYVETTDNTYECKARGSFRKKGNSPVVGDLVTISIPETGYPTVEEIHERKNSIIRPPMANIDTLVIVCSTVSPAPNYTVIDKMTNILNKNLSGTPLQELHYALNNVIKKDLEAFSDVMEQIVNSIKYEMSKDMKKLNSGVEKILENTEFSDIETVKNFINMISTKEIIDTALDKSKNNKLSIVIGSENKEVLLNDYTVISLDIEKDNKYLGKLSVIGPKRMNYAKTISTLKYINEKFNGILKLNKDNSAKEDNSEEGRK